MKAGNKIWRRNAMQVLRRQEEEASSVINSLAILLDPSLTGEVLLTLEICKYPAARRSTVSVKISKRNANRRNRCVLLEKVVQCRLGSSENHFVMK